MSDYNNINRVTQFGGAGPIIHFAHANAYPPGSYRQMIEPMLSDYQVVASHHRPIWGNDISQTFVDWHVLADDLIQFLDSEIKGAVHGVGHSMGAIVTLIAATKRPELFKSVVLIDPVVLPVYLILTSQCLPNVLKKRMSVIKKALGRKDLWASAQDAYDYHRSKKVFGLFSNEVLWDYINAGTVLNSQNKYTLTYSKEWEAHCYSCAPWVWPLLKKVQVPVLALRGEHSNVITPALWQSWKQNIAAHNFVEVAATGHLLPMESPQEVSNVILQFISQTTITDG